MTLSINKRKKHAIFNIQVEILNYFMYSSESSDLKCIPLFPLKHNLLKFRYVGPLMEVAVYPLCD